MTKQASQPRLLNIPQIAAELGFSESAVKKWRGRTIAVLKATGQLDAERPTVLLPTNALPLPANQDEHARDGVDPLWNPDVVSKWAERTQRRHPVTKATTHPSPPGRTPDPDKAPRARRRPALRPGQGSCTKHGVFDGAGCPGCPVPVGAAA
jgi:hypothetical protein